MDETRVFKSYNERLEPGMFFGGYDYGGSGFYEDMPLPGRRSGHRTTKPTPRANEWIKENPDEAAESDRLAERPINRSGQGISLLTIFGFIIAAALLIAVLMSHVCLTKLSDAASSKQQYVTELTEKQHKLQAEYEQLFSLSEVEQYASENLGMQKLSASDIIYLDDVAQADKAVIVTNQAESSRFIGLELLISGIRSYFG